MYQLPSVVNLVDEERQAAVEAASVLSGDGVPTADSARSKVEAPPVKVRPRPVVPEYLRDLPEKRRLLPAVAITFLVSRLVALVLIALGLTGPKTPIGRMLAWVDERISGKHEEQVNSDNAPKRPDNAGAKTSGNAAAAGTASAPSPSGTSAKPANSVVALVHRAPPERALQQQALRATAAHRRPNRRCRRPTFRPTCPRQVTAAPATVAPPDVAAPIKPPAKSDATGPAGPAAGGGRKLPIVTVNPPKPNIEPVPPDGPALSPAAGANAVPPPPKPLDPAGGAAAPAPGANEIARATMKPAIPPAGKSRVARYTSDGQDVLLTFDAAGGFWRRAMPEEFFTTGQPLLELPSYRSLVDVLDVGARIEMFNGTRAEILQSGPQTPLGVAIDFGRMVVKPLAQAGARLRIVAGSHTGTLTLASLESVAAFDVARFHEPGTDPEKVHSHAVTKLYVAGGSAAWEEAGKRPVQLSAPAEFVLDGPAADAPRGRAPEMPKWIAANTTNELDQRAALAVSQALHDDRSATMRLLELTEDRRKEVRKLAALSLGYLGQFDPLRSALNDADYRVDWPDYFDELKEAIARGPETAAAIRQSFERQFGADAPALYRMLWGYTDKDLESGADAALVKDLDHETLIFRVLAFSNLREITHQGLYYRPELPAAKRQQSVQRWKEKLRLGEIRWSPAATRERVPQPRTPPAAAPPHNLAPPPGPADGDMPDGIRPASATEPIDSPRPRPAASAGRPKLVFPEPGQ